MFRVLSKVVPECPSWDETRTMSGLTAFVLLLSVRAVSTAMAPVAIALGMLASGFLCVPLVIHTYRCWAKLILEARQLAPHARRDRHGHAVNEVPMLIGGLALVIGLMVAACATGLR